MTIHRRVNLIRAAMALSVVGLALVGAPSAPAQKKAPVTINTDFLRTHPKIVAVFRDVVAKPSQSTVRIQCDGKDVALGTVVGADGWIITKASQLKGTKIVCKLKEGGAHEAKLVGVHAQNDLAMLKVEATGLKPIEWTESKVAEVGNWVAAPTTEENPATIGVISVATRNVPTKGIPKDFSKSGYLGISLDPNAAGAKVNQVMDKSAASKAGLKVNDQILSVQGKKIEDQETLINTIGKYKPGDEVELKIKRGEEEMTLKAKLEKRPANNGDIQNSMGSELSERRFGFPTILQHDSVIKPIDCGGPLVDLDGKVVGINIARAGRTESYAIPSELVQTLLEDLKSGKLKPSPEESEKVKALKESIDKLKAEMEATAKRLKDLEDQLKKAIEEEKK